MCGIAGLWLISRSLDTSQLRAVGKDMAGCMHHRGPDDEGVFIEESGGLALSHRRLSILDLSSAGHQPMFSPCGRYVIVYNGEIYNHNELRDEIVKEEGRRLWRSHSDTETLLAGIKLWGLCKTLNKCVGMFAIALWDREERTLSLARDRFGEKPLYYGRNGGAFLFASELKAFHAYPYFKGEVCRSALGLYMQHTYIPAPYSIYRDIYKLLPGKILTINSADGLAKFTDYWSFESMVMGALDNPYGGNEEDATNELESLLTRSIRGQMIADRPLGAYLSGGIDSSAVVALMQSINFDPIRTFTIGVDNDSYNEAQDAAKIATYLGTDHTELYVKPEQAMAVIPLMPELYDEPFADSSQIPTFLVSQLAAGEVTVALSGDGGDELFGGYNRHFWASRMWRMFGRIPDPLKRMIQGAIYFLPPESWNKVYGGIERVLPVSLRQRNAGDKLHKLAGALNAKSKQEIYLRLISHWYNPAAVVIGCDDMQSKMADQKYPDQFSVFEHEMMYFDTMTYLPDDILAKVDRAAMGVSLETRIPMLDHRLVEFAWRLPLDMKIRGQQGKWLLRQMLYRHVPRELVERPKSGFGLPIDDWLRGPLREWAESLIDRRRLEEEGFFIPETIRSIWSEHLNGSRNWSYHLWAVFMFQAWLQHHGVSHG